MSLLAVGVAFLLIGGVNVSPGVWDGAVLLAVLGFGLMVASVMRKAES